MIYRKRIHKSGYSLGFTKGRQFIKIELGKRVWYIQYGFPVFWTMSGLKDIQDQWGQYTLVEHLVRKDRVTVDRFKFHPNDEIGVARILKLINQAER